MNHKNHKNHNIAVFLDRDGTINEEAGYINHPDRLHIYPWSFEAVEALNRFGIKAVVVTNQSGIARGFLDEDRLEVIHKRMMMEFETRGSHLDGIYYCPHRPQDGCECRKPNPGLLYRASRDLYLDLERCYTIGDKYSDVELGKRVGARSLLVKTGYGLGEFEHDSLKWPFPPDAIKDDLLEAVIWVLGEEGRIR